MKHLEDYTIIPTKEGVPIFVISRTDLEISSPVLLYDGGQHATLFASTQKCDASLFNVLSGRDLDLPETEAVLVDYIHKDALKILRQCDWVLFMEKDKDAEDVIRDYKVTVRRIDKNMLTDGLR